MPSFSKMGVFPAGYFRATTQWLLRERRDVVARIDTLQAELVRIGHVRMYYRAVQEGQETRLTEERVGFSVTKGSSLCKLVQAYIATGGNPFDISGFLHPDETEWQVDENGEALRKERYPHGGIRAPLSVDYNNPLPEVGEDSGGNPVRVKSGFEGYEGGYLNTHRYYPARMGGRRNRGAWDAETVTRVMHDVRKWANKEIKARLQDMEWRIIKLSDLHEQLRQERDRDLLEAFGGQLHGMPVPDFDALDPRRFCQNLIADMYEVLYAQTEDGTPIFRGGENLGFLQFSFEDDPAEEAGPLG